MDYQSQGDNVISFEPGMDLGSFAEKALDAQRLTRASGNADRSCTSFAACNQPTMASFAACNQPPMASFAVCNKKPSVAS